MAWGASFAECLREWEELQDGYQRIQVPRGPARPRAGAQGALRPSGARRGYRHRGWEMPRSIPSADRGQPGCPRWSPGAFPALGYEPCALGQSVPEQGRGSGLGQSGAPRGDAPARRGRGVQTSDVPVLLLRAAVPGVARPDEVRRCHFAPYRSSQPGSGQPGAPQGQRPAQPGSAGARAHSARHLVATVTAGAGRGLRARKVTGVRGASTCFV